MKKTLHLIFFIAHVLSILCCSRAYCEQSYITNSVTWRDTQGQIIEAPAMFKHNGVYFLVTSGTTGWKPNQGKYTPAPAVCTLTWHISTP